MYGYHISSFFGATIGVVIAFGRQYLRIAASPPNRVPIPDSFQPPCGSVNENRFASTSLTLTAPASSRSAIASPRSMSWVQTEADSTYYETIASRIAAYESASRITANVGPKFSSRMQDIEWSTSTSTVGS